MGWAKEHGPKGLYIAIRKLRAQAALEIDDVEWLEEANLDDLPDLADADNVRKWRANRTAIEIARRTDGLLKTGTVISDLFAALDEEIRDVKTGFLEVDRASEVAKFRTMQLRTLELIVQAGHLEMKMRHNKSS